MRASPVAALFVLLAVLAFACGVDRPPCYRGDFVGCSCADGKAGYQACRDSEDGYSACVCDGTTPGVDAGVTDAADATDASEEDLPAKRALFETCETNDDCESGLCHLFTSIGQVCTKACEVPEDCPPASSGCNNRGICRP